MTTNWDGTGENIHRVLITAVRASRVHQAVLDNIGSPENIKAADDSLIKWVLMSNNFDTTTINKAKEQHNKVGIILC